MMIERIAPGELDAIGPLLDRCRYGPYRFLARDLADELGVFWFDEIARAARADDGGVFVAAEGGRPVGLAVYSPLAWDTALFGRPMGAIKHVVLDESAPATVAGDLIAAVESWTRAQGASFLLCKAHTDDISLIHALETQGYLLMDTLLDYVYDARRQPLTKIAAPPAPAGVSIALAGEQDLDRLIPVARAAFGAHFGRYNADPRIPRAQSLKVYEEWVRSSVMGYADWIVTAESEGAIAGYSIWRKPSTAEAALSIRVGHYSIAGVHPDFRGRGLFGTLTYAGMELLRDVADCIEGPTHVNNYAVQRGYSRLSWQIADARHSFHKWLA